MKSTNAHVLPDSRLTQRPDFGCIMVDWRNPDGTTTRCEAQPIYCANCGKLYGHVPKENTTFAFWLCQKCFEDFGECAGLCAVPDDEWARAVGEEMQRHFGRGLTELEIAALKDQHKLPRELELLERESPFPIPNPARSA